MGNDALTIRFDDISINADVTAARSMADQAMSQGARVLWCISPLVHDIPEGEDQQRVFPQILKAYSDPSVFFHADRCGIPSTPAGAVLASHGLVHVDHRLLDAQAQWLSIITSCSLVGARVFVPPFNKWDTDTETICKRYNIELVKFEDGWKSMDHHSYDPEHKLWYCHSRRWTVDSFREWWK